MIEWIVSSCVLILLVMIIRQLFKKRLNLKVRYALWLVVAVRLLLPFSFAESSVSVLNLLKVQEPTSEEGSDFKEPMQVNPVQLDTLYADPSAEIQSATGQAAAEPPIIGQSPVAQPASERFAKEQPDGRALTGMGRTRISTIVWAIGSLLSGLAVLAANLSGKGRRLRSRRLLSWKGESKLPVYVTPAVRTPCMAGLLHPAIYLTKETVEKTEQLPFIIAHENTHYRHRDHLWAMVRAVCLCIHWFNPLVWLAAHLSRQDGELACDADALKLFDQEERLDYGRALLELSIQKNIPLAPFNLATTMSSGKRQLKERLVMIKKQPKRAIGVLLAVTVLVAAVLTVTFTGRKSAWVNAAGEDRFHSENAQGDLSADNGEAKEQSSVGEPFGYSDYTGYLDECKQWMDYRAFAGCDYDGDGLTDRVWRENIQDWGVADYRIEFGNGDLIELLETSGGIPQVRALDLEGDGVKEILFTESFGYSTNPQDDGQMALFNKTGNGYAMMELPGGMSQASYRPTLSFHYEAVGDLLMGVTCNDMKGQELMEVTVDFTQVDWEMGRYDEHYFKGNTDEDIRVPYKVDIIHLEDGCDALALYFGMMDKWCTDETALTLGWEDGSLRMQDINYWHPYIETAYIDQNGEQYELIISGSGYVGSGRYNIDSIRVVHSYYDKRFQGMVEDPVQFIDPVQAAKIYSTTIEGTEYGENSEMVVASERNANIVVADLNFDGYLDFGIQGFIQDFNTPYYCYLWDERRGQFGYAFCLENVETDEELKLIKCTTYDGDKEYGTRYYKYEYGTIVLKRFVKEDQSLNAVLPRLDLTYVETSYSVDTWDYIEDARRFYTLAEKALTELYELTGTKIEAAYFTVSKFGDVTFALTERELEKGKSFYSRCYGAQEGFTDCITHLIIAGEGLGYSPDVSPVQQLNMPPDLNNMTDEEIVIWYFEKSPLASVISWKFGGTVLKTGDRVETVEESFEGNYILKTKSGQYFELTYDKEAKTVSCYFGPYESYPSH